MTRLPRKRDRPRRQRPELFESVQRKEGAERPEAGPARPRRKARPNPKRKKPRRVGNGRVKLYGDDMTELRRKAFIRSRGQCEMIVKCSLPECNEGGKCWHTYFCLKPITWESMELCHTRHGPNKSDTLATVRAGCKECHRKQHNAGKPCKRKPGRVMNKTEAREYLESRLCFCGSFKTEKTAYCLECLRKISEQSRLDLKELEGEAFLQCLADCEKQILAHKPEGA